ncbi:MAG: hypothetical protein EP326_07685 [Deltaproteobacteria bacterium]|nr:MAG: hypothetical protein EP326_07685 [Deltaproteobacteria bacterium]TNF32216.1 MAG: hypothetical protein EP319_00130 [Deltaproteobacteria bacterium]
MIKLTFLFFSLFIYHTTSYACVKTGANFLSFYSSYEKEEAHFFNSSTGQLIAPRFVLSGCSKTNRKFLQFSIGIVEDYIDNGSNVTAIHENFTPASCQLSGSPFKKPQTVEEIQSNFKKKLKQLTKCFEITVKDVGGTPLSFDEQTYCKMEGNNLSGGVCYFGIQPQSAFLFEIKHKNECLKREFFEQNKLDPTDFVAQISFNVTDSSDGSGANMKTISSIPIRISNNPDTKLVLSSEDLGRNLPLFPGKWNIPDVHFGKINISLNGNTLDFQAPFAVDNRCESKCSKGVCSSPCHYSSPIAAELELYEIPPKPVVSSDDDDDFFDDFDDFGSDNDNFKANDKEDNELKKPRYITSWYSGGVAQGNWQGIIPGRKIILDDDELEGERRYRVIAKFRDPKMDYQFLQKEYQSILPSIPDLSAAVMSASLPSISPGTSNSLNRIADMLGSMSLAGNDGITSVTRAIAKFHNLLSYSNWPVYVDKACDRNGIKCKRPAGKPNLQIALDFDLKEVEEMGQTKLVPSNFDIWQKSSILGDFHKEPKQLPEVDCGRGDM